MENQENKTTKLQNLKSKFKILFFMLIGLHISLICYLIIYNLVSGTLFYFWFPKYISLRIFYYVVLYYLFKLFFIPLSYVWVRKFIHKSETLAIVEVNRQFCYATVLYGMAYFGAVSHDSLSKDKMLLSFFAITFVYHLVITIKMYKDKKKLNIDTNLMGRMLNLEGKIQKQNE